jgi:hypothetical protein
MINNDIGKSLIIIGIIIVITGVIFTYLPKGGSLPKLPGDIFIKKDNFIFYFPIVTSILVSIVLSIIMYLFFRK